MTKRRPWTVAYAGPQNLESDSRGQGWLGKSSLSLP